LNSIIRTNLLRFVSNLIFVSAFVWCSFAAYAEDANTVSIGNFGLPGLIDLPTANTLPDGEIVLTQQLHETLARSGIAFQAFPRVGFAFRYSGHGKNGNEAYGRVNHDRSFDVHISLVEERTLLPGIALGVRDFIGTGWYSSEYIVGSKFIGPLHLMAGLGFGRLEGRNSIKNPFGVFDNKFVKRDANTDGRTGTINDINWFQGRTSTFGGLAYRLGERTTLAAE